MATEMFKGERREVICTTLHPGYYIFVCQHCGFRYQVCLIRRKTDKCRASCHRCGKKGKHYKLTMEEVINFKENANNKLNCEYFTMIRLYDPKKHCEGNRFQITLKGHIKGYAHIVSVNLIRLDQIREYIARLDAGCSPDEYKKTLKEAYKKKPFINWDTQILAYCLMRYAKNENKLFTDYDK